MLNSVGQVGVGLPAVENHDLVALLDEITDEGRADEAGGADGENGHDKA